MKLWIVAKVFEVLSEHPLRMSWELVGVFTSADQAKKECLDEMHCFWSMDANAACHTDTAIVAADARYPFASA